MTGSVDSPQEMVQLARDAIGSRDDMEEIELRKSRSGHVLVVVEQETPDGETERILYRIEGVPRTAAGETLRRKGLGSTE